MALTKEHMYERTQGDRDAEDASANYGIEHGLEPQAADWNSYYLDATAANDVAPKSKYPDTEADAIADTKAADTAGKWVTFGSVDSASKWNSGRDEGSARLAAQSGHPSTGSANKLDKAA